MRRDRDMYHQDCANGIVDTIEKFYYKPLEKKRDKSIPKMLFGNNMKDPFIFKLPLNIHFANFLLQLEIK